MIKNFASRETERLFNRERSKKFPPQLHKIALRKLYILHAASTLQDLRVPPANRLEKLKGNRAGQYSIRINDQYRICFHWSPEGNASDVEITDYH